MMDRNKPASLADWLALLENRHHQEIQLGLSRVMHVAAQMDLLKPNAPVITVAGTNGKGSTIATLEALYVTAGYRVASYTSPHLLHFNERIRIQQQPLTDAEIVEAFGHVETSRGDCPLTYFEMTTLAALWHFKTCSLDVILLEVGMGGRLDATNVIDADCAVITAIDYDHQAYLGDTLEAIGSEKAGILRLNKPCVLMDKEPPSSVFDALRACQSPAYFFDTDYSITPHSDDEWVFSFPQGHRSIALKKPPLYAPAIAAAIMASICMQPQLPIEEVFYSRAMQKIKLRGRQEGVILNNGVQLLLDVSHNPQGARLLAKTIQEKGVFQTVHAVFSGLQDKDLCGLINPMRDLVDCWYPCILQSKRAATRADIKAAFLASKLEWGLIYETIEDAIKEALHLAKAGDVVVVYGSFLTVSAVIAWTENSVFTQETDNGV